MTQLYRSYQQQKLHDSKVNGCLFFYVKCSDAGITIDKDNKRTVIEDNLEVDVNYFIIISPKRQIAHSTD